MKSIFGANVRALIQARTGGFEAACKLLEMQPTQLKRILAGKHAVTMTTVEKVASAFDLAAYQLLIPGLDAANPQVLRKLNPQEERLYKVLADALAATKNGGTQ